MTQHALDLPQQILEIFSFLEGIQIPVWLVGGCLRDLIRGSTPEDWDFATPCTPEVVREALSKAKVSVWDTGLKHGTLTFRYRGVSYEITTFRRDGPYEDFRRPMWVAFTESLIDDLSRRDFTINAMAYHWKEGLSDPFGGLLDMEQGLIRAVGSPEARIGEDALRIMRAVRFAGSMDFDLDRDLQDAMVVQAHLLEQISAERLAAELSRIVTQPSPTRALALLADIGLWSYLAPELEATIGFDQNSEHHHLYLYEHILETLANTPAVLTLRLAALLHDVAKPAVHSVDAQGQSHFHSHEVVGAEMAAHILNRLRFSHAIRDEVLMLIRHHMHHLKTYKDRDLRKILSSLPKPRGEKLELVLLLQKADLLASHYTTESLEAYEDFAQRSRTILAGGYPLDIADLVIKGGELEELGIAPVDRGKALKAMLDEVLGDPEKNQREALMDIAIRFSDSC